MRLRGRRLRRAGRGDLGGQVVHPRRHDVAGAARRRVEAGGGLGQPRRRAVPDARGRAGLDRRRRLAELLRNRLRHRPEPFDGRLGPLRRPRKSVHRVPQRVAAQRLAQLHELVGDARHPLEGRHALQERLRQRLESLVHPVGQALHGAADLVDRGERRAVGVVVQLHDFLRELADAAGEPADFLDDLVELPRLRLDRLRRPFAELLVDPIEHGDETLVLLGRVALFERRDDAHRLGRSAFGVLAQLPMGGEEERPKEDRDRVDAVDQAEMGDDPAGIDRAPKERRQERHAEGRRRADQSAEDAQRGERAQRPRLPLALARDDLRRDRRVRQPNRSRLIRQDNPQRLPGRLAPLSLAQSGGAIELADFFLDLAPLLDRRPDDLLLQPPPRRPDQREPEHSRQEDDDHIDRRKVLVHNWIPPMTRDADARRR